MRQDTKPNVCLIISFFMAVVSCNTPENKVKMPQTQNLNFNIDSVLRNSSHSPAYFVYGKLQNNTKDTLYYFECENILNCWAGRFRRLGNWTFRIKEFADADTVFILPYSFRHAKFFFDDWESSSICNTDSIVIDLSHFYSSNKDSVKVKNICFGIKQEQIRIGKIQ
jgi:hypothetical protein